MANTTTTHFNSMGNKFWTHLESANTLHINVQQRYGQLLDSLKEDGVAFKDIAARLEKEAKRCGLWRRTMWDSNTGKMIYQPKSILKSNKVNWMHSMTLFLQWVKRNYVAYGVTVEKSDKRKVNKARNDARIKTTPTILLKRRKRDSEGNIIEVSTTELEGATREEIVASTPKAVSTTPLSTDRGTALSTDRSQTPTEDVGSAITGGIKNEKVKVVPSGKSDNTDVPNSIGDRLPLVEQFTTPIVIENDGERSITAPTTKELSVVETQAIILQNFDVLGGICKQMDALDEFNALMIKLGATDKCL